MISSKNKLQRIPELDALRGIACLMVILFHFTCERPQAPFGFQIGTTGVDLFFIISGFVIVMSLQRVSKTSEFVFNRLSRLYPTYWTAVTLSFILISIEQNKMQLKDYFGNMTMFQFYFRIPDIDGHYWTMIVEMIFYAAIALLFYFKWFKHLNLICLTLSILVVVITHCGSDVTQLKKIISFIPLLQFIPLFFAGSIFYKIYTVKTKLLENYLIILFCLICQLSLFDYAGRSKGSIDLFEYIIILTLFFGVFVLLVNNKLKFIVNKVTIFIGKISFALYLIHYRISIDFIIPYLTEKLHVHFWIASLLFALPISIFIASVITFYIEIPINKKLRKLLIKR